MSAITTESVFVVKPPQISSATERGELTFSFKNKSLHATWSHGPLKLAFSPVTPLNVKHLRCILSCPSDKKYVAFELVNVTKHGDERKISLVRTSVGQYYFKLSHKGALVHEAHFTISLLSATREELLEFMRTHLAPVRSAETPVFGL